MYLGAETKTQTKHSFKCLVMNYSVKHLDFSTQNR